MDDFPDIVSLQIIEVRSASYTEARVTVRNLSDGLVFRTARFNRLSDSPDPIDLELVEIDWYNQNVDELPKGHTALVILRGPDARALHTGTRAAGWHNVEGHNPPARPQRRPPATAQPKTWRASALSAMTSPRGPPVRRSRQQTTARVRQKRLGGGRLGSRPVRVVE